MKKLSNNVNNKKRKKKGKIIYSDESRRKLSVLRAKEIRCVGGGRPGGRRPCYYIYSYILSRRSFFF